MMSAMFLMSHSPRISAITPLALSGVRESTVLNTRTRCLLMAASRRSAPEYFTERLVRSSLETSLFNSVNYFPKILHGGKRLDLRLRKKIRLHRLHSSICISKESFHHGLACIIPLRFLPKERLRKLQPKLFSSVTQDRLNCVVDPFLSIKRRYQGASLCVNRTFGNVVRGRVFWIRFEEFVVALVDLD